MIVFVPAGEDHLSLAEEILMSAIRSKTGKDVWTLDFFLTEKDEGDANPDCFLLLLDLLEMRRTNFETFAARVERFLEHTRKYPKAPFIIASPQPDKPWWIREDMGMQYIELNENEMFNDLLEKLGKLFPRN